MKYSLAIVALLGMSQAVKVDRGDRANVQQDAEMEIRPNPILQPWSVKPPHPEDQPKITKITDAFTLPESGSAYYTRIVPAHFSTTTDDKLMWSLIMQFAVEGNTDGKANGHFYLTTKGMEKVAREVVQDHFHSDANKRESYLSDNLPRLWAYHDLLNEGFVDVNKAPVILRSLLGDTEINNGLQLQVGEEGMDVKASQSLNQFRPDPALQPWALKQVSAEDMPRPTKIDKAFTPNLDDHATYEREAPEHYSAERDDRLMHSLITKYALEGNTNGNPNGHFYMTKEATRRATEEVIGTHRGYSGK